MNLSNWKKIDTQLLVGLLNTELRNHSESLDDLAKTHDIPVADLIKKMAFAGYEYQSDQNQFR